MHIYIEKVKLEKALKGAVYVLLVIVGLESRTEASVGASGAKVCLHMWADGVTHRCSD